MTKPHEGSLRARRGLVTETEPESKKVVPIAPIPKTLARMGPSTTEIILLVAVLVTLGAKFYGATHQSRILFDGVSRSSVIGDFPGPEGYP